ncbi:MAG: DnaA/Hda family protein [Gallionella sp.]|nr:DnaA/Hda family protein [Gallionella sp.]
MSQPPEIKPRHDTVAVEKFRLGRLFRGTQSTFENFVVDKSNELAVFAASQIAESEKAEHDPLFIHGGVGFGKTHLLLAIGNRVLLNSPQAKVCYVHAELFVSDVVHAYQTHYCPVDFKFISL